jgi:hypothetical protein
MVGEASLADDLLRADIGDDLLRADIGDDGGVAESPCPNEGDVGNPQADFRISLALNLGGMLRTRRTGTLSGINSGFATTPWLDSIRAARLG